MCCVVLGWNDVSCATLGWNGLGFARAIKIPHVTAGLGFHVKHGLSKLQSMLYNPKFNKTQKNATYFHGRFLGSARKSYINPKTMITDISRKQVMIARARLRAI